MLRQLLTVIFSAALFSLAGQNSFHRIYTLETGHHSKNQAGGQLSDGNFISMDLLEDTLRDAANDLIITLFDKKGGIASRSQNQGAKAFRISTFERNQLFLPQKTSVLRNNNIYYFTGLWQENDSIYKVFGSLLPTGSLGWFHRYKTAANSQGLNTPFLLDNLGSGLYLGTNQRSFNRSLISLARANESGLLEWSSQYLSTRDSVGGAILNQTLTDLQITRDSSILAAGYVQFQNENLPFIMESDTLGNVLWSKMYFDTISKYFISNLVESIKLPDSSFVLACGIDAVGVLNQPSGMIIHTDTTGQVVWARKIDFGSGTNTRLNNLSLGNDNQIVVSGFIRDSISGPDYPWMAKITMSGDLDWVNTYPRVEIDDRINGDLVAAMDNGYALFSTADDGKNYLNLIKTDINGSSTCETKFEDDILTEIALTSTDVFWSKFDTSVIEKADAKLDEYSLSPPIITLKRDPTYCPKDTINHVFDATVEDAVYYEWSNGVKGDSASMITVHDTEVYSVMVTIDDGRACFSLCDTAQLRRYATPLGQISYSLGDFCTTGLVTLRADVFAEAGIKSFAWSTGASTNTIKVGVAGTYSVTITDNCDETFIASYELIRMPEIVTAVSITEDFSAICQTARGVLQAIDNSFGLIPLTYQWSSGETTQFISINEGGQYCVTVTDICGNSASSCLTVDQAKFRQVKIDDLIVDQTNRCINNTVDAEVFFTGDANILWSTGETTKSVTADMTTVSMLTVTITDKVCPNFRDTLKVNLPQIQFLDPLEIDFLQPVICIDDKVTLTVIYNQNILKPSDAGIVWSTGETTQSIQITQNGTYAVTVVDKNCALNRAGKSIDFVFPLPEIQLIPDSSALCTENTIVLFAEVFDEDAPIQNPSYQWSTGATTSSIIISDDGTYSVTVSDPQCALNTASASFDFVFPDAGMRFASVFFPNTTDTITMEYNATFGPYLENVLCPESIKDYEFYVFNRWGQKVFESFDIATEWNGTMRNEDESPNPTEAYIWAVKYTLFGREFKDHGDVTLIRK